MTVYVPNTELSDSFNTWRLNTNHSATVISNNVVTVTRTGAERGGSVTGNGHVDGTFSATTLKAHMLKGGNTSVGGSLEISSNVNITGDEARYLTVSANAEFTGNVDFNITGTNRLSLGDISRMRMTGGSRGHFLTKNGLDTITFKRLVLRDIQELQANAMHLTLNGANTSFSNDNSSPKLILRAGSGGVDTAELYLEHNGTLGQSDVVVKLVDDQGESVFAIRDSANVQVFQVTSDGELIIDSAIQSGGLITKGDIVPTPLTVGTLSVGKNNLKFKEVHVSQGLWGNSVNVMTANIAGDMTLGASSSDTITVKGNFANMAVAGSADFLGTVRMLGNVVIGDDAYDTLVTVSQATFAGNTIIGDANTDRVFINAKVANNIVPDQGGFVYNLGSIGDHWGIAYANTVVFGNTVHMTDGTAIFDGNLLHANNTIGNGVIINSMLQNGGFTISGDSSSVTVGLGQAVDFDGSGPVNVTTAANTVTWSIDDATTSSKGIAQFDGDYFTTTTGEVSLKDDAGGAVLAVQGNANEVEVSRNNGTVTVSLPDDVKIKTLQVNNSITVYNGITANGDMVLGKSFVNATQSVIATQVTNGGSGYTAAPLVTFSASPTGDTATGTAVLTGDAVTSITLTNEGSGYAAAPTISFSGGNGVGAAADPIMDNGKAVKTAAWNSGDLDELSIHANTIIYDNLTVTGDIEIRGSTIVSDEAQFIDIQVAGPSRLYGDVIAGTGSNDELSLNARVTGDIEPTASNTYSIGKTNEYKLVRAANIVATHQLTADDVIVKGNLTVNGTTTHVDSNTVEIGDNILLLNKDETGTPSQDAGLEIERGTATNAQFLWKESGSDGYWATQLGGAATVDRVFTSNSATFTSLTDIATGAVSTDLLMVFDVDTNTIKTGTISDIALVGPKGQKGEVGDKGNKGDQGIKGDKGDKGQKGDKGDKGDKGIKGEGFVPKGSVATVNDLPTTGNVAGDGWIVVADKNLYLWTGSTWNNIGQFTGDKGNKGDKGDKGQKGDKGDKGQKGRDSNFQFSFSTASNASAGTDPGNGNVTFNDTTPDGTTGICIDNQDRNATSGFSNIVNAILTTSSADSKGILTLTSTGTTVSTLSYKVTGVTQKAGFIFLTVTYLGGGTSVFANGEDIVVSLSTTGDKGSVGQKGEQGIKGQQGVKGQQGDKGIKGDQGIKGDKGNIGNKGDQGIKGIKGDKGNVGDKGGIGNKGDQGNKGDKGRKGGIELRYAGEITSQSNPGAGQWKKFANNSRLVISDTAYLNTGVSVADYLNNTVNTSSSTAAFKGILVFTGAENNESNIFSFKVSSVIQRSGYLDLTGEYVSGTTPTVNQVMILQAVSNGDKGDTGQKGQKGVDGSKGDPGIKGNKGSQGTFAAGDQVKIKRLGVNVDIPSNDGYIHAGGDICAYVSDERLKDFHGKVENALDKVCKLSGYYWTENETAKSLGLNNDRMQIGLRAQEVEEHFPELIEPAPIDNKYMTVKYERMVAVLIEAIKDLKKEIDELKGN